MLVISPFKFDAKIFFRYRKEIFCVYYYEERVRILHYRTGFALPFDITHLEINQKDEILEIALKYLQQIPYAKFKHEVKKPKTINKLKKLKGVDIIDLKE